MLKSSKSSGRQVGPARFLLAVPLLTVAVAACGGGGHGDDGVPGASRGDDGPGSVAGTDPGEAGVRKTYLAWYAAVGRGDGSTACSLMDSHAKSDMDRFGQAGSCERAVSVIYGYMGEPDRRASQALLVDRIELDGSEATVDQGDVHPVSGPDEWSDDGDDVLEYVDGRWFVHDISYG